MLNNSIAQISENKPNQKDLKRKKLLATLVAGIVVASISSYAYWALYSSHYVTTENAYTAVEIAQVTTSIDGNIKDIMVFDTQTVKQGDILLKIDNQDAAINLNIANAELEKAIQRVKGYNATEYSLNAQIQAREADDRRAEYMLASAESEYKKAKEDLDRRKDLAQSGSISNEELTHYQNAYNSAEANLKTAKSNTIQSKANINAAKGTRDANNTLLSQGTTKENPEITLARAKKEKAQLDYDRTIIVAPMDGIVAKRQVQIGQRIQVGTPLLSIVPIQNMHVDANFKEVQLKNVKPGQHAEIHSDLYGKDIVYKGVVEGFSGGTGSAFSVIPAQNATGNWIKVVQRLPVRIKLDPKELKDKPLNVGLSMNVSIDVTKTK